MLAWMAYSVLFAALVHAAAAALDRLAEGTRIARRLVWASALAISAVTPLVFATRLAPAAAEIAISPTANGNRRDLAVAAATRTMARVGEREFPFDMAARYLWAALSLGCVAFLARAAINIARRSRRWPTVDVGHTRVLVAPDVGPAVIGVFRPRVVVPQWTLSLDETSRDLMLRHEMEHVRARDPLLLLGATSIVVLIPWNPMSWLLLSRLRLAIEIDCDRRVLERVDRVSEYGRLLLMVSAHRTMRLPLAASLGTRRSLLERRIKAMTPSPPRYPRLVTAACIAIALVAGTAAARAPRPAPLRPIPRTTALPTSVSARPATRPQTPQRVVTGNTTSAPNVVVRAQTYVDSLTIAQVRAMIAQHQSPALSGDAGSTRVTLVVDANGRYVTSFAEGGEVTVETWGGRGARGGDVVHLQRERVDHGTVTRSRIDKRENEIAPRVSSEFNAGPAGLREIALDMPGFNQPALGTLIDLSTVRSVRLRTYAPGQLGSGLLYVYVVVVR